MTRLALIGAGGRVGRLIVDVLPEFPNIKLVAAVVSPASPLVGTPVPHVSGLSYTGDIRQAAKLADVVVDFSKPETSVQVAQACVAIGTPCLIATTGQTEDQRATIVAASAKVAVLIASNTSVGVYVATRMAELAAKLFGDAVDVEIVEMHHRGKRDAPSGTAKSIASTISESQNLRAVVRGTESRQPKEIGLASVRGGDVVGEHTVYFLGQGEQIELTHRATDRAIFARGAIRLAQKLAKLGPGLKRIADLI